MRRIAAVVLAAGESTRFGRPKQHLLLPLVIRRLVQARLDEIVIVAGAVQLELPDTKTTDAPVHVVTCTEWELGPGASLRCGLGALGEDVDAALVVLGDGPELSPHAIERVLGAWRGEGGIVAASYGGSRGHPLVVGRELWNDVPDAGLHERPARLVPCDDLGAPGDVDTPADLAAYLRKTGIGSRRFRSREDS
jgi:CTP:molybdopterin cytidylyltransferase MocA